MKKRLLAVVLIGMAAVALTACSGRRSEAAKTGASKVILGIGQGIGDSVPYVDTDEPPVTPTPEPTAKPTPEVSATPTPTPEVSPTGTLQGDGTFSADDCALMVSGMKVYPGMILTDNESKLGTLIEKLEGQACLTSGYDINYYYYGFHVDTIQNKDGKQVIYLVNCSEAGVMATEKGIGVGSSEEDLITVYGAPQVDTALSREYIVGDIHMVFYVDDAGTIKEITITDASVR